jgi:hypothetical protein
MTNIEEFNLFNFKVVLWNEALLYMNESHCLYSLRRNESGYAGDRKAEAYVRQIAEKGSPLCGLRIKGMIDHEIFIQEILELMTDLWCVTIRGKVSRNLLIIRV